MAVIRVTQIDFGAIEVNVDTNINVTQIDLGNMGVNDNTNVLLTQIVFLSMTKRGGVFRELFSPLTSTDELE